MPKIKVAIVVAHFEPALDYFETTAAHQLGFACEVHVIASTRRASTLRDAGQMDIPDFLPGTSVHSQYVLHRLRPTIAQGQRVLARGVLSLLEEIGPDLVIQEVPSQGFSISAATFAARTKTPLVYISGENSQQGPQQGARLLTKRLYTRLIIRPIIRYCVRRSSLVLVTTPETGDLIRQSDPLSEPILTPLPYRSEKYALSVAAGRSMRQTLDVEGKHVTLFIGRVVPAKRLEMVLDGWSLFAADDPDTTLVIAGLGEDTYSYSLRQRVECNPLSHRIVLRSFGTAQTVNALLNAADVTVWPTVSVGIQQAMGTGSFVLMPKESPGSFLLSSNDPTMGLLYENTPQGLSASLKESAVFMGESSRIERAAQALASYSDVAIASLLLDSATSNSLALRNRRLE